MYSNKNQKAVATIFVVTLFCSLPTVAMDSAFSYQARLDDGGSPANGTYDLRFFLYDAEAGGSQVGSTLYADDILVSNGLFSAYLDFGPGIFDGDPLWLEVAVRPGASVDAYTPLFPRQAIMPSPYSLHAGTIEIAAIGSAEVQDNSLTSNDLGLGSVGTTEVIDNSLTADDLAPSSVASNEVLNNSLTAADLAPNSVGALEIAAGAVGSSEIADGSVTSSDIANSTITYTDTNTGSVQRRVTETCASGFSIRSINTDGSVTCQEEYYTSIWVSGDISASSVGEGEQSSSWMKPDGISNSACFLTFHSGGNANSTFERIRCSVWESSTHWSITAESTSGNDNFVFCKMRCLYWYVY